MKYISLSLTATIIGISNQYLHAIIGDPALNLTSTAAADNCLIKVKHNHFTGNINDSVIIRAKAQLRQLRTSDQWDILSVSKSD
ncbi:MAG: hypothetical protein CMF46_00650 [Legionellales bacterium]|nr:hypothetical protein [Legionellales bacterium]|tara:strand:+ start:450 stop:701 length:252 start_codon:yes stop_codon:yes gene_type:complete